MVPVPTSPKGRSRMKRLRLPFEKEKAEAGEDRALYNQEGRGSREQGTVPRALDPRGTH